MPLHFTPFSVFTAFLRVVFVSKDDDRFFLRSYRFISLCYLIQGPRSWHDDWHKMSTQPKYAWKAKCIHYRSKILDTPKNKQWFASCLYISYINNQITLVLFRSNSTRNLKTR